MRIDLYTRAVLTAIALLLAVIAVRPYVSPETTAFAQGTFAGVQFVDIVDADSGSGTFFDTRSGEIWVYSGGGIRHKFRLTKLGQPIVKEK
jgi:hypothetical protein